MKIKYIGEDDLVAYMTDIKPGKIYSYILETRWGSLVLTVMDDIFPGTQATMYYKSIKDLLTDWEEVSDL